MNELVRKTKFLGNYKTILGDGKTDIVLETLGKVYIKTGNNLKLLNEIFKLLDRINHQNLDDIKKSVIITSNLQELEYPGDGILVFNFKDLTLYISYDDRYILLLDNIDLNEYPEGSPTPIKLGLYVKKTGDTMTGALTITYKGAPLIVASKELVVNFNALFIDGYSSSEIAIKKLNEYILGHWTFKEDVTMDKNLTVNRNALINKNLVVQDTIQSKNKTIIDNIIGTEIFTDGYNGYGWRLDSNTNTLTVDTLIVRKAMYVYELVVNRISATNGSLWVTDSTKVNSVLKVELLDLDNAEFISKIKVNTWYLPKKKKIDGTYDNISTLYLEGEHIANSNGIGKNTTFYNYGYLISFNSIPVNLITLSLDTILTNSEIEKVPFFRDAGKDILLAVNSKENPIYKLESTPYYFSTLHKESFIRKDIQTIYSYYKYFASDSENPKHLYKINLDSELFPTIREGDLLRCLKFKNGCIKYYDALVVSRIGNSYSFIILLAASVFDKYSDTDKNELINVKAYDHTDPINPLDPNEDLAAIHIKNDPSIILAEVEPKDNLVRIGSIINPVRRGSLYLSSSDANSPNLKVLDGVNKPDYSVLYTSPKFSTIKYKNKSYFYILEEKDTGKENCHQIGDLWYSLFINPTLQCAIETTKEGDLKSEYTNHVKVQLGKLDGIHDDLFGNHQPKGYGLYGLNVYLTGEFYLNNGKSVARIGDDILLQVKTEYAEAGLSIKIDDTTKKSSIVLNGDQIIITNGDKTKLAAVFQDGKVDLTYARISDKLDVGNGNFVVDKDGSFTANNASLKGDIVAGDKTSKIEILSNNGDPGILILYEPEISSNFSFDTGCSSRMTKNFSGYNYISIDCDVEIQCSTPSIQDESITIVLHHDYSLEEISTIVIPANTSKITKTIFWNHNRTQVNSSESCSIGIFRGGAYESGGSNTITLKNLRVFNAEYLIYPSEPSINIYTENQLTTLFNGASTPNISSNEQINCLKESKKALFSSDNVKNHIISLYTYNGLSKNFNLAFTGYIKNLSKLGNMKNSWGIYLRHGSSEPISIKTFKALSKETSESIDISNINVFLQFGDILEVHVSNVLYAINPGVFGIDLEIEISKCILTEISKSFAHYYTNGFIFKSEHSSILAESNNVNKAHLDLLNPNVSTFISDLGINYSIFNNNQSPSPILIYKGVYMKSNNTYILSGYNIFTDPFNYKVVNGTLQFQYPSNLKNLINGNLNKLFIYVLSKILNQQVIVSEITDSYFVIKYSGKNIPEFYILINYYNFLKN